MALFTTSPRLETLYAIGASSSNEQNVWTTDEPWTMRLAGLRKLTITDLELLDDLELLLGCCRALSELHFSFVDRDDYWEVAHLLRSLTPVQRQLRHLTLTWVPRNNDSDHEDPDPYSYEWALELGKQLDTVDTFRKFGKLEVLAVDQASLPARGPTHPVEPAHRLPTCFHQRSPLLFRI